MASKRPFRRFRSIGRAPAIRGGTAMISSGVRPCSLATFTHECRQSGLPAPDKFSAFCTEKLVTGEEAGTNTIASGTVTQSEPNAPLANNDSFTCNAGLCSRQSYRNACNFGRVSALRVQAFIARHQHQHNNAALLATGSFLSPSLRQIRSARRFRIRQPLLPGVQRQRSACLPPAATASGRRALSGTVDQIGVGCQPVPA